MLALLGAVVGVALSIGYWITAGFAMHVLVGQDEWKRQWIFGLFLAIYALLLVVMMLVTGYQPLSD